MPFQILPTSLDEVRILERHAFGDQRGFFARLFDREELAALGWTVPVAQVNHSFTARRGSIRGMHYQRSPHADMKLVTCIRGAVLDVALDVRAGSPTLAKWHGEVLSADNRRALLIPEGFAHGFQALTDDVELIYCHSAPYVPAADAAHNVFDPVFGIDWPEAVTDMSDRDRNHAMLANPFEGVAF